MYTEYTVYFEMACGIPSLKLTSHPLKLMVGRQSFPFGGLADFQELLKVNRPSLFLHDFIGHVTICWLLLWRDLGGIEAACLSSCAGSGAVVAGAVYLMIYHVTRAGYVCYICHILVHESKYQHLPNVFEP